MSMMLTLPTVSPEGWPALDVYSLLYNVSAQHLDLRGSDLKQIQM